MWNTTNSINILLSPAASTSSQKPPHWQVIEMLGGVFEAREMVQLVPLNSTEIAILGGIDDEH